MPPGNEGTLNTEAQEEEEKGEEIVGTNSIQLVPLCSRIKAKKIDLMMGTCLPDQEAIEEQGSTTNQTGLDTNDDSNPACQGIESDSPVVKCDPVDIHSPPDSDSAKDMSTCLILLESNEEQLKEKLIQLECINKEFVRELELREKLFMSRELQEKEWKTAKEGKLKEINSIDSEIKQMDEKINMILIQVEKINQVIGELITSKKNHPDDGSVEQELIKYQNSQQHNKILLNSLKEYQVSLQNEHLIKSQELHSVRNSIFIHTLLIHSFAPLLLFASSFGQSFVLLLFSIVRQPLPTLSLSLPSFHPIFFLYFQKLIIAITFPPLCSVHRSRLLHLLSQTSLTALSQPLNRVSNYIKEVEDGPSSRWEK